MSGSAKQRRRQKRAQAVLSTQVAFGHRPMVSVAAGSVDLRKAHCVAGNQACDDERALVVALLRAALRCFDAPPAAREDGASEASA